MSIFHYVTRPLANLLHTETKCFTQKPRHKKIANNKLKSTNKKKKQKTAGQGTAEQDTRKRGKASTLMRRIL